MKVPPLIINLKSIEKQDKHKEHKKHKKHKKHKHKHHHHDHEHSSHHHSQEEKLPTIRILNPPLLEPVGMPEPEHNHLYPYQSSYAPPSPPNPYPNVLHPIATPPSQREQRAKEAAEAAEDDAEDDASVSVEGEKVAEVQPPVLEDKAMTETNDDSKQPEDNQPVIEPPVTLEEAPPEAEKQQTMELDVKQVKTLQESNSQLSYLKLSEDGGVRLNIIGPIKQADEGNEKILNLEQICGQLQEGLDVIPSDINDEDIKEQLQVNPVEPIETPTFGSYLPIKDSTFANLNKEDSEVLLEIYGGNEKAFGYAESLQNYASGTNYLMKMVDSLLDLLTEGRHNSEAVPIRQKLEEARKVEAKSAAIDKLAQNGDTLVKPAEPLEDKMEVDTAPTVENQENTTTSGNEPDEIQEQLNEIDTLLSELRKIQEQRLSSSPAPVEPNDEETNLANEVLAKMTKLIKEKAKPSEICESSSILKALGIPLDTNSEIKLAD